MVLIFLVQKLVGANFYAFCNYVQNIQNHKNPEIAKWGGGYWSTQITNAEKGEKLVTLFIYLFLSSSRLNFEGKAPKNVKFGIPSKSKGEENPKS